MSRRVQTDPNFNGLSYTVCSYRRLSLRIYSWNTSIGSFILYSTVVCHESLMRLRRPEPQHNSWPTADLEEIRRQNITTLTFQCYRGSSFSRKTVSIPSSSRRKSWVCRVERRLGTHAARTVYLAIISSRRYFSINHATFAHHSDVMALMLFTQHFKLTT